MIRFFNDFINLMYPENCFACGRTLHKHEKCLCTFCSFHLPKTDLHKIRDNKIDQIFWGRVPISKAASYLYFTKGSKVQNLIHQLKYKGKQAIGEYLGEQYGKELKTFPEFQTDLIIPVPLHKKKQRIRGYNQSECFCKGLSVSMGIKVDTSTLKRIGNTETQTRKSRFTRWQNMNDQFVVGDISKVKDKTILLVDDVITTGATIESCAITLLNAGAKSVSVVSIACA